MKESAGCRGKYDLLIKMFAIGVVSVEVLGSRIIDKWIVAATNLGKVKGIRVWKFKLK